MLGCRRWIQWREIPTTNCKLAFQIWHFRSPTIQSIPEGRNQVPPSHFRCRFTRIYVTVEKKGRSQLPFHADFKRVWMFAGSRLLLPILRTVTIWSYNQFSNVCACDWENEFTHQKTLRTNPSLLDSKCINRKWSWNCAQLNSFRSLHCKCQIINVINI